MFVFCQNIGEDDTPDPDLAKGKEEVTVQEGEKLTYFRVQVVKLQSGGTVQEGKDKQGGNKWAKFTHVKDQYTEEADKGQLKPPNMY